MGGFLMSSWSKFLLATAQAPSSDPPDRSPQKQI
jgi:hypothetical protein